MSLKVLQLNSPLDITDRKKIVFSNRHLEEMSRTLIVGGSGLIGSGLLSLVANQDSEVGATNRTKGVGELCVDLSKGDFRDALDFSASVVFFCAAMTNIQTCENAPDETRKVNVSQTLALIKELVRRDAFVVWLSSSTVFDGQRSGMTEDSPNSPITNYGRQKAETEQTILGSPQLAARVAIVRLSKVVSPTQGIAAEFMRLLQSGELVEAFSDLYLSPVSLAYVCRGLQKIAQARVPGVFHLSGETELSYSQFARLLADRAGAAGDLVRPVVSVSRTDVHVLYRPRYPALRMTRTTQLLGLQPEPIASTFDELFPLGAQS